MGVGPGRLCRVMEPRQDFVRHEMKFFHMAHIPEPKPLPKTCRDLPAPYFFSAGNRPQSVRHEKKNHIFPKYILC